MKIPYAALFIVCYLIIITPFHIKRFCGISESEHDRLQSHLKRELLFFFSLSLSQSSDKNVKFDVYTFLFTFFGSTFQWYTMSFSSTSVILP